MFLVNNSLSPKTYVRKWLTKILLCSFIILLSSSCKAKDRFTYKQPPSIPEAKDTLVGVNYFNGWWEELPNKWLDGRNGQDWRNEFPGRLPLLGQYNSQEVMGKEIKVASSYGIDFFQVLWYYIDPEAGHGPHVNIKLNDALDHFTNSPNSNLMQFCIEFCNHEPFIVKDFETWNECIDIWLKYMKHPSYLKIENRPVFKIHGAGRFWHNAGGTEKVKKWVDFFRKRARKAGLGEILIGCGNTGVVWEDHWAWNVFDFSGEYMIVPDHKPKETDYPYDWLAKHLIEQRGIHRFDKMGHIPFLASGWNPRPWTGHTHKPAFEEPTRDQWIQELKRMAFDLENLSGMGIPLNNGTNQKIFTIYAWNEFGEGGILAPTKGQKYIKLEGIREIFGVKNMAKNE